MSDNNNSLHVTPGYIIITLYNYDYVVTKNSISP